MNPLLSGALRALLFALGLLATLLPRRVELLLGPPFGRLLLALDLKRKAIAYENIRRCLPELGEDGWRGLLARNYEHYGILVLELLHLFSPVRGHYRRYVERNARFHGFENWARASSKGKGALFVSSHLGNWELMVGAASLAGLPVTMVTRRTKPEWLRARLEAARAECGVREAYDPRTMPAVLRALRRNEAVGFVIDQYAPPPAGVPARFFGVEVDTLSAIGPLAERTGAAVIAANTRRGPDGVVHVFIGPELELGEALRDPLRSTQLLASKIESWIRESPEQWLWVHRRFKNLRAPQPAPAGSTAAAAA